MFEAHVTGRATSKAARHKNPNGWMNHAPDSHERGIRGSMYCDSIRLSIQNPVKEDKGRNHSKGRLFREERGGYRRKSRTVPPR